MKLKAPAHGRTQDTGHFTSDVFLTACSSSDSVALKSDSPNFPPNEPCAPRPPLKNAGESPGNTWWAEEHDSAKARFRDSFSAASLESPGTPRPCQPCHQPCHQPCEQGQTGTRRSAHVWYILRVCMRKTLGRDAMGILSSSFWAK